MDRIAARRVGRSATLLMAAVALAGCGASTSWILSPEGCTDKATIDAELHVDPTDERWIWAIDRETGAPISLRIPGGYGVDIVPPTIIDVGGQVIGRTGDTILSGCTDVVQNALLIDETDIRRVTVSP